MARAHCAVVTYDPVTNTVLTAATVNVYNPGTVTPISATMYDKNSNVLTNPLTSDATTGLVDFYLNVAQEVDLVVSKGGFTTRTYSNVPVLDDASYNLTALLASNGAIVIANGANVPAALVVGNAGALLWVTGGQPAWLAAGSAGQFLTIHGGVPTWQNTIDSGGLTISSGNLIFGGTVSATGVIRLAAGNPIGWRNNGNTGDNGIYFDTGDQLRINGVANSGSATAGANGATPAQVAGYWNVNINGTNFKVPLYQP